MLACLLVSSFNLTLGQTMLSKSLCLLHQHPCNLLLLGNCLAQVHHSLDLWHQILLHLFGCHFQCHLGRPIFFMVQTHNRVTWMLVLPSRMPQVPQR